MIRVIIRRLLAWDPRRSRHPYLAAYGYPCFAAAALFLLIYEVSAL